MFGLADEVLDAGDALIVRSGGQEERISLSDIKNVSYSRYMSPPQVTLSLRRQTVFGDTISFCAPVSVVPFQSSPVIDDLINRADSARQKRGLCHPPRGGKPLWRVPRAAVGRFNRDGRDGIVAPSTDHSIV